MKIQQNSSVTFLRLGAWVVMVMSTAAISWLELMYFMSGKNHSFSVIHIFVTNIQL